LHVLGFVLPATTVVSSTVDTLQAELVVAKYESQVLDTLSPSFSVNGFEVRAQWYPPHECVAPAPDGNSAAPRSASGTTNNPQRRIHRLIRAVPPLGFILPGSTPHNGTTAH